MEEFDEPVPSPPPPARPSKIPSWVMLGFVIGALTTWSWQQSTQPSKPAKAAAAAKQAPAEPVLVPPRFTDIEAVFSEWGKYAIWEDDLTEVALWDHSLRAYANYFEVTRSNGNYYFRTIPRFTRPILNYGVKSESPMQFTEPESHRRQRLKEIDQETMRSFIDGVRKSMDDRSRVAPQTPVVDAPLPHPAADVRPPPLITTPLDGL